MIVRKQSITGRDKVCVGEPRFHVRTGLVETDQRAAREIDLDE